MSKLSLSWLASGIATILGVSGIAIYFNSNNNTTNSNNSSQNTNGIININTGQINSNNNPANTQPTDKNKLLSANEKPYGCAQMYGNWSTFVRGLEGEKKQVFIFNSNYFNSPYTSQRRACEVANRFNAAKEQLKNPKFTSGKINGLGVVCLEENGSCKQVLFTLKPGERPEDRIPLLQEHMGSSASGIALYEAASCREVFDLNLLAGTTNDQKKAISNVCAAKY